jgi:hypothetical protein
LAGGRRRHHDAAVAGVAHVVPRGVRDAEAAQHVHAVDEVPVLLAHLLEAGVAQDAGVVDDDVDALPRVERTLDDLRPVLDRVVVGHGLAAGGLDLLDHRVGRGRRLAAARVAAAQIVHDDLGAAGREQQGMGAAEAVAGAGDDGDPVVEAQIGHDGGPLASRAVL